jgi:hypothetical protein
MLHHCTETFFTYADCTMTGPWPLVIVGGIVGTVVGVVKGVGFLLKKIGDRIAS